MSESGQKLRKRVKCKTPTLSGTNCSHPGFFKVSVSFGTKHFHQFTVAGKINKMKFNMEQT